MRREVLEVGEENLDAIVEIKDVDVLVIELGCQGQTAIRTLTREFELKREKRDRSNHEERTSSFLR